MPLLGVTLPLLASDGGAGGTIGATQVAQALALDAGLVPEADREAVLDYLVEDIYAFNPSGDGGPHLSGSANERGLAPDRACDICGRWPRPTIR